jgi:ABC-type Fe3+-hydroxamate transport system substrate-binding protein
MSVKPRRIVLLLLFSTLMLATGCLGTRKNGPPQVPNAGAGLPPLASVPPRRGTPSTSYPLSVTRDDGKRITLRSQPRRMAVLAPGPEEILYAIGAGPQILATSPDCDYPSAVTATTRIPLDGGAASLAATGADLVITSGATPAQVAAFDATGVPVLSLQPVRSFQELLAQIQFFGDVAGHPLEAQRLAAGMNARLEDLQRRIVRASGTPKPFVQTPDGGPPPAFAADLLAQLKAQPSADAAQASEVIRLVDAPANATPVATPGAFEIPAELVERPGPRAADGLTALASALYPNLGQ